jgi:hypothetical protein
MCADSQESRELFSERLDRIRCEASELLEKWDKRLTFPLKELSHRYLRRDFCIHLHFYRPSRAEYTESPGCAVFYCADGLESGPANLNSDVHKNNRQFPMLVESIQLVNEPQGMLVPVRSYVWLQKLDSCESGGTGDSLYFSAMTGRLEFLFRFLPFANVAGVGHGEFALGITGGELPSNVVERRPQVMDNLASKQSKSGVGLSAECFLAKYVPRITVAVGENWISPLTHNSGEGSEERVYLPLEIADVLIGPF